MLVDKGMWIVILISLFSIILY